MRRSRIQQIKPKPVVKPTNKPYVPLASVYEGIRPVTVAPVQTVDFSAHYIAILQEMSHADVMKALKNPALKPSEFRTLFEHLLPHQRRAMLEEQTLHEFSAAGGLTTGGYDAGSPTVQLVTAAASVPGAPTIYAAECPSSEPCQTLYIDFGQPASDGGSAITDYEYSVDDGENWLSMGIETAGPFYAYGDAGNIAGQELFVRVRAVNAVGAGASSTVIDFMCTSCIPSAPESFQAYNVGDCQLSVYYQQPEFANGTITHYEMTTDDESTWTNIGFNGLGEEYHFSYNQGPESIGVAVRVRAVNATGAGDATNMIPVTLTSCAEQ